MKPITRLEHLLDAIINSGEQPFAPYTREEFMLVDILNGKTTSMTPMTRIEQYLAKISGKAVQIPEPVTRLERYLAKACGEDISVPNPITRIEHYLYALAEGGAGEEYTLDGTTPLTLADALAHGIKVLTQYGKTVQSTTPTPDSPVDIVCNNGAVRYGAVGKNLCNVATDVNGYAIDANGNETVASNACYSALIPVTEGEYTYSGHCSLQGSNNNKRVHGYYNGAWVQQVAVYVVPAGVAFSYTFTVPSGIDAIRISHWSGDAQTQVEHGSTATAYEPFEGGIYTDGTDEVLTVTASGADTQTASVQNLFAVGDVSDEQNIISGHVTRKIGVKVFDGTETFSKSSAYGKAFLINAASSTWGADRTQAVLCTHFLGLPQVKSSQDDNTCFFNQTGHFYFRVTDNSDTDAFKAWLAAQYSNGTPVILLFVLAEETAETVTGQSLSTAQGTNTVSVTSEVGNVGVEVTYTKAKS